MSAVHIYTAASQPATRFVVDLGLGACRVIRNHGGSLCWTSCCHKLRPAKNLTVRVYYDSAPFFCRPGKGCKRPSRRIRVTSKRLLREFHEGRSFLALARKFGMTVKDVDQRLRTIMRFRWQTEMRP